MPSNNVWVVDDDRSIRWVLERALEQAGMNSVSFDSGDAMLARLFDDILQLEDRIERARLLHRVADTIA